MTGLGLLAGVEAVGTESKWNHSKLRVEAKASSDVPPEPKSYLGSLQWTTHRRAVLENRK